jgi:hypothetical protein
VRFAAITLCLASRQCLLLLLFISLRLSPETFGYTLVCGLYNLNGKEGQKNLKIKNIRKSLPKILLNYKPED